MLNITSLKFTATVAMQDVRLNGGRIDLNSLVEGVPDQKCLQIQVPARMEQAGGRVSEEERN
jgi:hypothetical protein